MNTTNKLSLLCAVFVLFAAGCGKKKQTPHIEAPKETTKVASAHSTDIPLLKEETENLLEDGDISDFAFVDDEIANLDGKDTQLVAAADTQAPTAKEVELESDMANVEEGQSMNFAFKNVYFDFNKNEIRNDQKQVLEEDIKVAQDAVKQGKNVIVEGHCDQVGSATFNLALSQRRAESIKKEMVCAGLPAENIKTLGYGFERPVVWSDEKDRAQLIKELQPNRRAEVITN